MTSTRLRLPPLAQPEVGADPLRWVPAAAVAFVVLLSATTFTEAAGPLSRVGLSPAALLVLGLGAGAAWACSRLPAGAQRQAIALVAGLTLQVALPITRLSSGKLLLECSLLATTVIFAAGLTGTVRAERARGQLLLLCLLLTTTVTTALSPDVGASIRWLVSLAAVLPAFTLAVPGGEVITTTLTRTLIGLAALESVMALVEPLLFPAHLWATAQLDSRGEPAPLLNDVLGNGLERSQGTLGHPLPLGLLLVLAVALLFSRLNPVRRPGAKVLLVTLLMTGLAMAGARNAVALAVVVMAVSTSDRPRFLRLLTTAWVAVTALCVGMGVGLVSGAGLAAITEEGSYTHRLAAFGSVPALLLQQDLSRVLFGNGFASTQRLFDAGLFQNDGFRAVDNQLVLLLGQGGLVGVALLVGLLLQALIRGQRDVRPCVWCVVVTMLVFDVLTWPSAATLCFVVLAMALRAGRDPAPG